MGKAIDLILKVIFGLALVGFSYSLIAIILDVINLVLEKKTLTISALTQEYLIILVICVFVIGLLIKNSYIEKVVIQENKSPEKEFIEKENFIEDVELNRAIAKFKNRGGGL